MRAGWFVVLPLCILAQACGSAKGVEQYTDTGSAGGPRETPRVPIADQNFYYLVDGPNQAPGAATLDGNVRGNVLVPVTAVFDAVGNSSSTPLYALLYLSDNPNFCADLTANANTLAGSSDLRIEIRGVSANGSSSAVSTGTYTFVSSQEFYQPYGAGAYATGTFSARDDMCYQSLAEAYADAAAGQVIVDGISFTGSAARLKGSFSNTTGTKKDLLSGTFEATPCPGMLDVLSSESLVFGCRTP